MNPSTRRLVLGPSAVLLCLASLAPAAPAARAEPARPLPAAGAAAPARAGAVGHPPPALARAARPLTDLRPLGRMIGTARVVGVGEATHGSREFFTNKHRIFRYLVEEKGFTTFALEANWSTGLRLNDYVLHGRGDVRRIMREEFQNAWAFWNTREYLDLLRWMRAHNVRHPHHPVQFMGNDLGWAGPELFDAVTGHVARTRPRLLPRFTELYRASRPDTGVDAWEKAYPARPLAERRRMAEDVRAALALLERQPPGPDREEHALVLRHARVIAQTGTVFAYDLNDPEQTAAAMLHRDRAMAENTVWWQRHTGHRMLLSAHNAHVGYESANPHQYPRLQGAFMRDALGRDYVNVGMTFGRGSFNAHDPREPGEPVRTFTLGPRPAGTHEHTLDRVAPYDHYLDLRSLRGAARRPVEERRPTLSIGTAWPWEGSDAPQRLAGGYDVVVHLHRITAAGLLR
ncbi:erythromycin esterase family protein [Streptomyces wuyuanensis]|uniref:erythromycin esterase family protein n=1 Tax=Streptomyces wuyuanensis TaxID=1196353 RepID=UPI003416E3CA